MKFNESANFLQPTLVFILDGPIVPLQLGAGFCRGPKWTFQKWPIPKGRLTLQDCAEECAKKKGCTAFDISEQQKDKFHCLLYGHKAVVPATGVIKFPAKCYVLKGSPLSKLLDEEDIISTGGDDDGDGVPDDEEDEDDDEGKIKKSWNSFYLPMMIYYSKSYSFRCWTSRLYFDWQGNVSRPKMAKPQLA